MRRYVRIAFCHDIKIGEILPSGTILNSVVAKNLSGSGLLFESTREYPVDTPLQAALAIDQDKPLLLSGRVVHSRKCKQQLYDIGLSFHETDLATRLKLATYIMGRMDMDRMADKKCEERNGKTGPLGIIQACDDKQFYTFNKSSFRRDRNSSTIRSWKSGRKLADLGILPIRMDPIGQKNDHQIAFRIDPERGAGEAEMADTGRGKVLPGRRNFHGWEYRIPAPRCCLAAVLSLQKLPQFFSVKYPGLASLPPGIEQKGRA